MVSPTVSLSLLCTVGACALLGLASASSPVPVFSTETTLLQRGRPFIASCQFGDFANHSEAHYMRFRRNSSVIFRYDFPAASSGGSQTPTIHDYSNSYVTVRSLLYNRTLVQVEITPLIIGDFYYECENDGPVSPPVFLKVVQTLPTATISLNTAKPTVGHPFTASCSIANFNLTTDSNYSVGFHHRQEGLLAVYRMDSLQPQVLIKKHTKLNLHVGERTVYPTFDLLITERETIKRDYWCSLSEGNWTVKSSHWSDGPLVELSSFKLNETSTLATCSIANFSPAGRNYSVIFLTNKGAHENNEIASYTVRPGKILEFDTEPVYGWTDIVSPEKVTFPVFPVIATGSGLTGHWMSCKLSIGEEGNAHYPEYKSEKVVLD